MAVCMAVFRTVFHIACCWLYVFSWCFNSLNNVVTRKHEWRWRKDKRGRQRCQLRATGRSNDFGNAVTPPSHLVHHVTKAPGRGPEPIKTSNHDISQGSTQIPRNCMTQKSQIPWPFGQVFESNTSETKMQLSSSSNSIRHSFTIEDLLICCSFKLNE